MSCPICNSPTIEDFRPFCSARCKQVDLGNWFSDMYVIEGQEEPENIPNEVDIEENEKNI